MITELQIKELKNKIPKINQIAVHPNYLVAGYGQIEIANNTDNYQKNIEAQLQYLACVDVLTVALVRKIIARGKICGIKPFKVGDMAVQGVLFITDAQEITLSTSLHENINRKHIVYDIVGDKEVYFFENIIIINDSDMGILMRGDIEYKADQGIINYVKSHQSPINLAVYVGGGDSSLVIATHVGQIY
jgi:hypothetical protein